MNVTHLTDHEITAAHAAAGHLLSLDARLDPVLLVKLDTLRADLTMVLEDRGTARRRAAAHPADELAARRAQAAGGS